MGGSVESTSNPALDSRPSLSASAKSCSAINPPRPVLIIIADGFMVSIFALLITPCVSVVSGQCNERTSDCLNNSESETNSTPSMPDLVLSLRCAMTFIPKANPI